MFVTTSPCAPGAAATMVVLVAENKTRQARIEKMVNPLTFYAACDGGADTVALHRVQGRHGWGCAVVGEVGTRLA